MLEMNRITLVKVLAQIFFGRKIGFRLDYFTTLQLERMCENWTGGNWDQTKEERRPKFGADRNRLHAKQLVWFSSSGLKVTMA